MSLIEFCYTLDNATEIRETILGYLPRKPAVDTFISEFLRRIGKASGGSGGGGSSSGAGNGADEWIAAKSPAGKAKAGGAGKKR